MAGEEQRLQGAWHLNLDQDVTPSSVSAPSPATGGGTGPATASGDASFGPVPERRTSAGQLNRSRFSARLMNAVHYVSHPRAQYQAAVFRIGMGLCIAAFLLREWPHRRVLYGDHSPWSLEMAVPHMVDDRAFSILGWWSGRWWFEFVYNGTIVAALLLMLGWRTRATSVLCMVGYLSLQFRAPYLGNAGDTVLRIMMIYLVFTRCAEVWSLDAHRRRRDVEGRRKDQAGPLMWQVLGVLLVVLFGFQLSGWPGLLWALWGVQGLWYAAERWLHRHESRALLERLGAVTHNCAMLVIAVQVCLIYATAGWYKVQGARWQDGTAVYYPMKIDYFAPFPRLNDLLTSDMSVVFCLSYGTVIVQVAFPFALANRKIKNILLPVMLAEHVGIAITLGLPFFSLAMIVCDAFFLPTAFLLWAANRPGAVANRLGGVRHVQERPAKGVPPARTPGSRASPL